MYVLKYINQRGCYNISYYKSYTATSNNNNTLECDKLVINSRFITYTNAKRGRLKVATKGQIGGCASEEAGGGVPCSELYGLIRRRFRKFPVPVRAWAEDSYI